MEILSLKIKSKRNSNVFVANTDEGEFLLHSEIIVKNSLGVGQIDRDKFFSSVEESEYQIALAVALKYIGSLVKTEKQIKDNLAKKGYNYDIISRVVDKLKEYKVVDDKTYADMYIKSNPKYSKNKLKQKLYSFGVKAKDSDELLESVDDETSCMANAVKFMKNKTYDKATIDKLIRRLAGMGYNWDTIHSTLNKLKVEIGEE